MFSTVSLNSLLQSHPIFESAANFDDIESLKKNKAHQLIHITSGSFFIWENKRSCLLTTNFRDALNNDKETIQVILIDTISI